MIQVRFANEGDLPGIHSVRQKTWRKTYAGLLPDNIIQHVTADRVFPAPHLEKNPFNDAKVTFIAIHDKEIIGFVTGGMAREKMQDMDAELYAIYVDPDFQGKSAGAKLFRRFVEEMRARGVKRMGLWVLKENPSRRFYEKMGGLLMQERWFEWDGQRVALEVGYEFEIP